MGKLTALLTVLLALSSPAHSELDDLVFLTEAYPPYNMIEGGELRGMAVDLLLAATERSGMALKRSSITLQPWPRSYLRALRGPNVVLFSTTRTEQRESLFQWVGPIADTRVVLLMRRDNKKFLSGEINMNDLNIGVIRHDIGEQMALSMGAKEENLSYVNHAEGLARMLNNRRIDAWAYEENVARWFMRLANYKNEDFVAAKVLSDGKLFYSLSKDISPKIVNKLQQAIDVIRNDEAALKEITDLYF